MNYSKRHRLVDSRKRVFVIHVFTNVRENGRWDSDEDVLYFDNLEEARYKYNRLVRTLQENDGGVIELFSEYHDENDNIIAGTYEEIYESKIIK